MSVDIDDADENVSMAASDALLGSVDIGDAGGDAVVAVRVASDVSLASVGTDGASEGAVSAAISASHASLSSSKAFSSSRNVAIVGLVLGSCAQDFLISAFSSVRAWQSGSFMPSSDGRSEVPCNRAIFVHSNRKNRAQTLLQMRFQSSFRCLLVTFLAS